MSVRRQPPVHSPVSWRAVAGAWGATFGIGGRGAARELEEALRAEFAAESVLLTDSGTSALALAMRSALDATAGGAVALPAYGCYDLATAADAADVPVVLYDVDPRTLGPVWESFESALTNGVRAAVVVHLYGYPVDMVMAAERCTRAGAVLIEDAAQGTGGYLGPRVLGSLAPLSVLSFGRGKGVTGGGGGALLGRGDGVELAARARHALSRSAGSLGAAVGLTAQRLLAYPSVYGIPASLPWLGLGETVYRAATPAERIGRASAVATRHALRMTAGEGAIRLQRARRLQVAARGSERRCVTPVAGATPGYLRLAVVCAPGENASLVAAAGRDLGVVRGYPRSLADLDGFGSRFPTAAGNAAGARALADRLVTLPTHRLLTEADLTALSAWFTEAPAVV